MMVRTSSPSRRGDYGERQAAKWATPDLAMAAGRPQLAGVLPTTWPPPGNDAGRNCPAGRVMSPPRGLAVTHAVDSSVMSEMTRILDAAAAGDRRAAAELLPLVYEELRKLAAARMAVEDPGHTLSATALVHEAYLRLVGDGRFDGRGTSSPPPPRRCGASWSTTPATGAAGSAGAGRVRVELLDHAGSLAEDPDLVLSLDALLDRLGREDAAAAQVAHLHLFGGLSVRGGGPGPGAFPGGRLPPLEVWPGPGSARPWEIIANPRDALMSEGH